MERAQQNGTRTVTVEQAAKMLGIGRSLCYELVRRGEIPSLKLGGRWVVPIARLEAMIEGAGQEAGS
jgi:excisionase family DNA binding protein